MTVEFSGTTTWGGRLRRRAGGYSAASRSPSTRWDRNTRTNLEVSSLQTGPLNEPEMSCESRLRRRARGHFRWKSVTSHDKNEVPKTEKLTTWRGSRFRRLSQRRLAVNRSSLSFSKDGRRFQGERRIKKWKETGKMNGEEDDSVDFKNG